MNRIFFTLLLTLGVCQIAHPQSVTVANNGGRFQLLRDGKPYTIRGVGGDSNLAELSAAGGNSIRTWNTDGLDKLLDEAQEHGLSVCVGMWLGHERHGFEYSKASAVLEQVDGCLDVVRKYKDHPAVLVWAIGNEMEGDGTNPAVWYAVNHIAREIKSIDPDHPTMTVIAELGENESKIRNIGRFCPDVDIVGINSYGGIGSVAERYRKANVTKPYIITEHGLNGPWEVGKTSWGTPLEATSTEKGRSYAIGFRKAVTEQPGLSLGSYAFLWGHKQETTATWFGMLLPDGSRLAAVDAMTMEWTGKPSPNLCPTIKSLRFENEFEKLKPGQKVVAKLVATDPEQDPIEIEWALRSDSGTVVGGGDFQASESSFTDAVVSKGASAELVAPEGGGGYRLFAYVRDGQGGAAVANIPVFVDAPIKPTAAARVKLPFEVYADGVEGPYSPSGYMGNAKAIKMDLESAERPKSGKTCLKVEYNANDNWGGVLWQSPPDDWDGTQPGGFDVTDAEALEFYVRGANGDEVVSFSLGVIEGDNPFRDSAKAELKEVRLSKEWQKMRIPLNGLDLSRIKTGFGWSLAGQGKPVVFYLDDIRYVAK